MRRTVKAAVAVALATGGLLATAGAAHAGINGTDRGRVGWAGCVNVLSSIYDYDHSDVYQNAANFGSGTCTVYLERFWYGGLVGRTDVHVLGSLQSWQTPAPGYYDTTPWTARVCINDDSHCSPIY